MTLWEIDIYAAEGQPDPRARAIAAEARDLGVAEDLAVVAARGYLLEGDVGESDVRRLAAELLSDPIVERTVIGRVGDAVLHHAPAGCSRLVHVLPLPGVMDPVRETAR